MPSRTTEGSRDYTFKSVEDIRTRLRTQNQQELTEALTALRNQLTVKFGEPQISSQDDRLLLAQHWLDLVPGAHDIFDLWEGVNQKQASISALLVSVLTCLLTLLSSHYTYQALGQPIIKTLLAPPWIRRLNSHLGGSHAELILVTLKLFNCLSVYAGGREQKSVLEAFAWEIKSLPKLLNMRRKLKPGEVVDTLTRPDIRTFYVLFILSFVSPESNTLVKANFLEHHRDVFLPIFKGLIQDSYSVVRKVLEVCWAGLWCDPKIKRTLKIGIFSEATLSQIIKVYDRAAPEDTDPEHVPADLVHHFLLTICTRPGIGICFKDRGWYQRESDGDELVTHEEDHLTTQQGGKIYNKILGNILKSLKVNEDSRQQELALKIMFACPELVTGYWKGAALTLEPRLSSKWIANISFFGSVISLPVPSSSFSLPNSTLFQPSPPPLSSIIENIFPVNTKNHFTKGLQSTSALVQHCSALALSKCLIKYEAVMYIFRTVETALEEDDNYGQWCKRRREVEREVRRRVPDFQVVVAFSHGRSVPLLNRTGAVLLAECAQRLLWMYHRCLPSLVVEARFDVGKLLQNFTSTGEKEGVSDISMGLQTVQQLHVLRLLKESDQFAWNKTASSSHSYLYVLLKANVVTEAPAVRTTLTALLRHILSQSILFQEDADEPYLWLASLPARGRGSGFEAPDGARLTDERDCVITFLDDCVQRCLKTPYRYLEDMYALTQADAEPDESHTATAITRPDTYPSPLLMTVSEQLGSKLANKLLTASDVLALVSFVQKLVFRLSTKLPELRFLDAFAQKVDSLIRSDDLFPQYPVVSSAIRRELSILRSCLQQQSPRINERVIRSKGVHDFLNQVEQLPVPESVTERVNAAFELVDWLRLVDQPIQPDEIQRLANVIERFHRPALREVTESLDPAHSLLWGGFNIVSRWPEHRNILGFEWLFVQSGESEVSTQICRNILLETLYTDSVTLVGVKRAFCLVTHRLSAILEKDTFASNLLLLLGFMVQKAQSVFAMADTPSLKEYIFTHSDTIKKLCSSQSLKDVVQEGLAQFVGLSLDASSVFDRRLAADISLSWLNVLRRNLMSPGSPTAPAIPWIKYLESDDLFALLELAGDTVITNSAALHVLNATLVALARSTTSTLGSENASRLRLGLLPSLRPVVPDSAILEDMIAMAILASLPVGCDGRPPTSSSGISFSCLSTLSERRWSCRLDQLPAELDFQSFLTQESWTPSTVKIISGFLYQRPFARRAFLQWFNPETSARRSMSHLASVLYAFLDASFCQGFEMVDTEGEALYPCYLRLCEIVVEPLNSQDLRTVCSACISLMILLDPSKRSELVASLLKQVQQMSTGAVSAQLLAIGNRLHASIHANANDVIACLVDKGLQWAMRAFADPEDSEEVQKTTEELSSLVKIACNVKPHLVEPVISSVMRNRLVDKVAVSLVSTLVKTTELKPVIINRHLQNILQHAQFFKLCGHGGSASRDSVVHLVHILFHLHPSNTCQPSHVEPLVRVYGATASATDRKLLSIFQLFEIQRKSSVASLISRWSPSPDSPTSTALEALQNLDPIRVLRTCLTFPKWRCLEDHSVEQEYALDAEIYDPVFLVLLFTRMSSERMPSSASSWVGLFRTNVVSLLIRCLSSKDDKMREVALCQIVGLWKCLETADMQEKPHVAYILNLLKNALPPPSEEKPTRLPSYASLILLHALRAIFYPSNFIYPLTARFLLQRPELDTNDVPMLYGMLYSSSDDWKKERGWIIRFLADGMMSTDDWRVLQRRHTWDILSSLFQSSERERALRNDILEVLANITCNSQAVTSLVLKSGLLQWIEMQLLNPSGDEGVAWVRILRNIITVVDHVKLESATNGDWRAVFCRCLSLLLTNCNSSSAIPVFGLATPVILHLSLLPGSSIHHLPSLVAQAVTFLRRLEDTIVSTASITTSHVQDLLKSPQQARGLHEVPVYDDPVRLWGDSVESLWRVTMTLDTKTSTWDILTSRLLMWRSMIGEKCTTGEWARQEAIRNLNT